MRYAQRIVANVGTVMMLGASDVVAQGGGIPNGKYVSTNPLPPATLPPKLLTHLGTDIPPDIEQYRWKVGPINAGDTITPTYTFNEAGRRLPGGSVAVGTEVKPDLFRVFGGMNYFCIPKKLPTPQSKPLPSPYNCEWVVGMYVIPDGPIAGAAKR